MTIYHDHGHDDYDDYGVHDDYDDHDYYDCDD